MASNNSNTVSFKVFLKSLDGETEARRFVVDRDVATSFAYLQVKLLYQSTFIIRYFTVKKSKFTLLKFHRYVPTLFQPFTI